MEPDGAEVSLSPGQPAAARASAPILVPINAEPPRVTRVGPPACLARVMGRGWVG